MFFLARSNNFDQGTPMPMPNTKKRQMRFASFFAGIGGFDLGLERAGMSCVFQCEVNKFCHKVLKKHWPDVPLHPDINLLSAPEIPEADLWCGGFPCQDLSIANQGKRRGLDGDRSGLFYKYAELVKEAKPRWILVENVPGLLNSHQGEDFKILLQTLDKLGYGVSWRVLDAKYFGTPQRRRRVYVVGSLGTIRSREVLFDASADQIFSSSGRGKGETITRGLTRSPGGSNIFAIQHASIGRKPNAGPQAKGYRNDEEAYTLDSRGSADAVCSTSDGFGVRAASGVSEGLDSNRLRAVGNAVCVPIVEWVGRRIIQADSA